MPKNEHTALCFAFCPQVEKIVVAYDSNHIKVFDLLNQCVHKWSKTNTMPRNFLSRYQRLVGVTALSETKFLFYSNYTYTVLDITLPVKDEVKIT